MLRPPFHFINCLQFFNQYFIIKSELFFTLPKKFPAVLRHKETRFGKFNFHEPKIYFVVIFFSSTLREQFVSIKQTYL